MIPGSQQRFLYAVRDAGWTPPEEPTAQTVTRRRTRRVFAALGAGALALSLATCGSSAGTAFEGMPAPTTAAPAPAPFELVAAAGKASRDAGTAKVALVIDTSAGGRSSMVTGEGVSNPATGATRLTILEAVPGLGNATLDAIVLDGVIYVGGMPGQDAGTWVKAPIEQAALAGIDASTSDVTAALVDREAVNRDVTGVGPEQLRGVAVTRYRGTLDVARLLAAVPTAVAEENRPIFESSGLTAVPFEVWLDSRGCLAKLTEDFRFLIGGEAVTLASTLEFYDWGTQASIFAPDPASVVDAPVSAAGASRTGCGARRVGSVPGPG